MKPFVLISQARSGSTMLGGSLGRHPQVAMHGEIFGGHKFPLNFYGIAERLPWPTPIEVVLKKIRDRDHTRFLDEFVFADTARTRVGFKFKFEEFNLWPGVVAYIEERNIPILYLRRIDPFERYLSEVEAGFSGYFNTNDNTTFGPAMGADVEAQLSMDRITRAMKASQDYHEVFKATFHRNPILELTYETMVPTWKESFHSVCRFLEIAETEVKPLTEKRTPERRVHALIDTDAIRASLIEAGYLEQHDPTPAA